MLLQELPQALLLSKRYVESFKQRLFTLAGALRASWDELIRFPHKRDKVRVLCDDLGEVGKGDVRI